MIVRAFQATDQRVVRRLIQEGLGERWGFIDESLNPDLGDIATSFAAGYFACAWVRDEIVGVGGFLPVSSPEEIGSVQIQRMSVAAAHRRDRVGTAVLAHLIETARARGFERAMLETTDTWADAIAFYERNGFRRLGRRAGDAYFELDLVS